MIKEEWKKLGRNKFLILAILVIALIPTMYGTIFSGIYVGSIRSGQ